MPRPRRRYAHRLLALALLLTLVALPTPTPVAAATTYTVTTGDDSGPGSLRQTIADAAPGDTIAFAPGVATVTLTSATLAIAKDLTIDGGANGHATGVTVTRSAASGTPAFGLFTITGGTVALAHLSLTNGLADSNSGGGVRVDGGAVTLTNSTLSGNSASIAGGGVVVLGGTVTLTNSTLSRNAANFGGGVAAGGSGRVTLTNSTFSDNSAIAGYGGGVLVDGGTATLTNTTLSGNTAPKGGGVYVYGTSSATLINSTLSGNTAPRGGGGVYASGGGSAILAGTIIAGNASALDQTTCSIVGQGTITDGGHNLETANTCGFSGTSQVSTDPQLGPLADNGGPTQTHLPALGSPARDKIPAANCTDRATPPHPLATDQRGVPRPQGAQCDSGAVEAAPYTLAASPASGVQGTAITLSATLTTGGVPLAGLVVSFTRQGTPVGTATTDASGVATLPNVSLTGLAPHAYPDGVGASVPATAAYAAASASAPLTVTAPPCVSGFADVPSADPACPAIAALAQSGVIKGYTDGRFGPTDNVQRQQLAALLVRALGWQGRPISPHAFADLRNPNDELQRAALILANACRPANPAWTCVAAGYATTPPTFGPADPVTHAQVVAFIARAFQLDPAHAWTPQSGGAPYTGVPATFLDEVATYHAHAGLIPNAPTTPAGWAEPASRAWVAQVLYAALQTAP